MVNSNRNGGTVFRHRPYLKKRGREILNRESRRIRRENPDSVEDPDDLDVWEVLESLQEDRDGFTDTGLLIELLGQDLTPDEAVAWILFQHSGLDPVEIFYAEEGKETAGRGGVDQAAVRHIHSKLDSAAMKLGVEFDPDRSRYKTE